MYKRIVVPLDGSELAECVLPHVENIAKAQPENTPARYRRIIPISLSATGRILENGLNSTLH
jgi:hypothetical protein